MYLYKVRFDNNQKAMLIAASGAGEARQIALKKFHIVAGTITNTGIKVKEK